MIRMKVRASVKKISPDDKIVRRKGYAAVAWRSAALGIPARLYVDIRLEVPKYF